MQVRTKADPASPARGRGVQVGAALPHRADRREQFLARRLLEHIARRPARHRLAQILGVIVHGEDQHDDNKFTC